MGPPRAVDQAHALPAVRPKRGLPIQELATGPHVVTPFALKREREVVAHAPDVHVAAARGKFWLPVIEKPVNVMRGDPLVMPFAFCQWFDQLVRFRLM